jgi:NAD(P)H-nitrite reductase large subunit
MIANGRVKYLVIGNSAGGIGAAEAIRSVDKHGSLAIVSEEPYPAYSRPLISEYLAKNCSLERMSYRPADFYEKQNIQTMLGKSAVKLDVSNHTIELKDGRKIHWRKLLLATGALPIIPDIAGTGLDGVFTFTTLDDAKKIVQYLDKASKAVVIGGGLIGMSVAEALVERGKAVTIVEMKERTLNTILDKEASDIVEGTIRQAGVNIITGHYVDKIAGNQTGTAVSHVTLNDGRRLPCDLVVVAIGVKPRTELAVNTPIAINRGIVVDRYMSTTCPDIYACGDVAESYDFIYGDNRLTPIWPNAYMQGRIAGLNMTGIPAEYPGGTAMNSLKYFGLAIHSAGIVTTPDSGYQVLSQRNGHTYKKIIVKGGLIVGMVFAGDIEKSGMVFGLMRDRVNVDSFKEDITTDGFGLASLPGEVWRSRLEMPAAMVSAKPNIEQTEEILVGE